MKFEKIKLLYINMIKNYSFCIIEIVFLALLCVMDYSSNSFNRLLFQYIYFLRFDKTLTYPTLFTLSHIVAFVQHLYIASLVDV